MKRDVGSTTMTSGANKGSLLIPDRTEEEGIPMISLHRLRNCWSTKTRRVLTNSYLVESQIISLFQLKSYTSNM